jgi:hypothetical protein
MEQVTIMPDNPRMSLREHKELINQVLGHEKGICANRSPRNDMIPNFSINDLPW